MVGGLDELRSQLRVWYLALSIAVVACSDGQPPSTARPASEAVAPVPGMKVDSILPPAEALERFLANEPVTDSLSWGARQRDKLVSDFLEAIAARDTAALASMLVTRAEYGFLYYPTSIYSRKPYELAPDIAWMLNAENNAKGATRLLQRLGGRPLTLIGVACNKETTEGANRFLTECVTVFRSGVGAVERRKLFGSIIERGGRLKFLSYAGDF